MQHAWSVAREQFPCYHYVVDDDEALDLIARGKAKKLAVPFACYHEAQRRGIDSGTTIDIHA